MKRTKVKNLAKQIRGVSYKPEDLHDSLDEDSVILLRANNIDEGKINFDDVVYVDKSKVSDEQYLKVGDVLICASSGSKQLVGKAASVAFDSPCTFGAFCKVVRPNTNVADYLGKYFQSGVYRRKISEVAIGANINNIRNEHIDSLELPIYEPAQAQRIVEKIGLLQNIIDNRKCELSKLDELIKARFVEMFGDPKKNNKNLVSIGSIGHLNSGGTPSRGKPEYFQGNIKWFTAGELNSLYLGDTIEHISEDGLKNSSAKLFKKGTLMIGMYDTAAFKMGILTEDSASNQACANLEPNDNYDVIWLYYVFSILKPLYLNERQGVRQQNLSLTKIKNLQFPAAPFDKQKKFADFVREVDKSKVAVQAALDKAQLLFDSLMQEYFG